MQEQNAIAKRLAANSLIHQIFFTNKLNSTVNRCEKLVICKWMWESFKSNNRLYSLDISHKLSAHFPTVALVKARVPLRCAIAQWYLIPAHFKHSKFNTIYIYTSHSPFNIGTLNFLCVCMFEQLHALSAQQNKHLLGVEFS